MAAGGHEDAVSPIQAQVRKTPVLDPLECFRRETGRRRNTSPPFRGVRAVIPDAGSNQRARDVCGDNSRLWL